MFGSVVIFGKAKAEISVVPFQSGSLTYTGAAQSPVWNGWNEAAVEIGGVTSAVNAGTYAATFTPKEGYVWSDGSVDAKTVSWTIGRASLAVPTQKSALTYTGSELSPAWNNYDSGKLTIGGTVKGINAGSYNAAFTPKANYQWSDGTTGAKTVSWSIGTAAGSLSIDKDAITLDVSKLTDTITVTKAGDGEVSATSSDASVAEVSVSGNIVTVKGKAKGTATITIKVAASTNYAAANQICTVTIKLPSATLNSNTPEEIQAAARAGIASNYWSVGDSVAIKVNGTFGGLSFNDTVYAFILGFNHNSEIEGNNSIHFQFGKNHDGKDIAFVQDYGSHGSGAGFCMNIGNGGSGGWKDSYMRNTICTAFFASLPIRWQNVISSCTKYSDNTGGGGDDPSYVTSTSDKIWLLSEFEVYGTRSYANSAEQNYQAQYDYYKNGNSKVKYQHRADLNASNWWLRSVCERYTHVFCDVYTDGSANRSYGAYYSLGFAPCFAVA